MEQDGTILVGIHPDLFERPAHFPGDRFRGVGLKDPAMAAQQVEDEPIGDRGAVGDAPPLDPGNASGGELLAELDEKSGLADARLADDADRLATAAFDLPQEIAQNCKLAVTANESGWMIRTGLAQSRPPVGNPEQPVGHDRLSFALERERPDRL